MLFLVISICVKWLSVSCFISFCLHTSPGLLTLQACHFRVGQVLQSFPGQNTQWLLWKVVHKQRWLQGVGIMDKVFLLFCFEFNKLSRRRENSFAIKFPRKRKANKNCFNFPQYLHILRYSCANRRDLILPVSLSS